MAADKKEGATEKIVFNNDLYWGMPFYIKTDPQQNEYLLVGIKLLPGVTDKKGSQIPAVKFKLQSADDSIWLYDFECSIEPDSLKEMKSREDGEDDD